MKHLPKMKHLEFKRSISAGDPEYPDKMRDWAATGEFFTVIGATEHQTHCLSIDLSKGEPTLVVWETHVDGYTVGRTLEVTDVVHLLLNITPEDFKRIEDHDHDYLGRPVPYLHLPGRKEEIAAAKAKV